MRLVYLHGFNSSPRSHKAVLLERYMAERGLAASYACPALPSLASEALARVEPLLEAGTCLVGYGHMKGDTKFTAYLNGFTKKLKDSGQLAALMTKFYTAEQIKGE